MTGAEIEIETLHFSEMHDAIASDAELETPSYDIVSFVSQWLPDYVENDYLQDLSQLIENDPALRWEDITLFFRDFIATYQDRPYAMPLDGDFLMAFYRADVLEDAGLMPPTTWDEYLGIAQKLHGRDLDQDGIPDYGSCISKQPSSTSYWMLWAMASPMLQSLGTQQGTFFDVENFEPLVRNPAVQKAFELYAQSLKYGPANEMSLEVADTRTLFMSGRCALTLDWGDPGTLALEVAHPKVRNQIGTVVMPGSREVWNRQTDQLEVCNKILCPYAIDGINYAPYAAAGGWTAGVVRAIPEQNKLAAYAFLSYVSQPEQSNQDVTIGSTGFNPYRISQFRERGPWLDAGMSQKMVSKYLGAIEISLSSQNMVLDLRIPQTQRYQQEALDGVLTEFLQGELTSKEAVEQLYRDWETITQSSDRHQQLAAYRKNLGLAQQALPLRAAPSKSP